MTLDLATIDEQRLDQQAGPDGQDRPVGQDERSTTIRDTKLTVVVSPTASRTPTRAREGIPVPISDARRRAAALRPGTHRGRNP